jgi:deoxyribodipyrimidine photo-lyase
MNWVDRVSNYDETRDIPGVDGTSQLSPYLAIGALSPRQIIDALQHAHPNALSDTAGVGTFISEICWRDFYRNLIVEVPRLSMDKPFKLNTLGLPWSNDTEAFERWKAGQTGIPIVDAAMRQLNETGWMHNRCRMITAMFLTKNLFINWRWGEDYFMNQLIDGDLASNNGGWQWSASTGTDAAPYFRIMNPVSQSLKFDPSGDYIRRWVPELTNLDNKSIHEPYAKGPRPGLNYPQPLVDLKQSRQRAIDVFKQHLQETN